MTPKMDIPARRLWNHWISQTRSDSPEQVVSWPGALQAQDNESVKWAVGLRSAGLTTAGFDTAVAGRTIVRTWLMRGTLQLVAAADVGWMLALLAPRLVAASAGRYRQLALDEETLARSLVVFERALADGNRLTRQELLIALEQAGISTQGQRGYHILRHAGLVGLICFGPSRGRGETFVLLREWVPHGRGLEPDEALAELAQRYFRSHGPATLGDFVSWSGLKITDARRAIGNTGSRLAEERVADVTYWAIAGEASSPEPAPTVHLLPAFDEYYLGYQDRGAVLDPQHDKTVVSSNGIFRPMIVLNGRVAGIWKRSQQKDRVMIAAKPFLPLTRAEHHALRAAAGRYSAFAGLPIEVDVGAL